MGEGTSLQVGNARRVFGGLDFLEVLGRLDVRDTFLIPLIFVICIRGTIRQPRKITRTSLKVQKQFSKLENEFLIHGYPSCMACLDVEYSCVCRCAAACLDGEY